MEQIELTLSGIDDYFTQEAYKVLRSNLQFCGKDIKVIMLTSYEANEGKTTVSMHLGKSFADLEKRVLVIDADMRKSVVAGRNTNAQNVKGLSEVLTGFSTLENAIYRTQYPNLSILFAGKYPPNPVELLSNKHFADLVEDVKNSGDFDYIIIDTPPLGMVIDAAVVAQVCDGVVLVLNDNARYGQTKSIVEQLKKSDSKILGVVRNRVSSRQRRYYNNKRY